MGRTPYKPEEDLLSHPIIVRVNTDTLRRLEKLQEGSNCQTLGEVARNILAQEKILMLYKDASMNGCMEELAGIRKELKAIGININQLTKGYNGSRSDAQRNYYTGKVYDLHLKVKEKVDRLLTVVGQLAEKWL